MVGAAAAATLQVLVPRSLVLAVADHPALSVLALGGLAVLLAICSEADAFGGQPGGVLADGPAGLPGRGPGRGREADRHAVRGVRPPLRGSLRPLTFAVAVACALVVGQVVLR